MSGEARVGRMARFVWHVTIHAAGASRLGRVSTARLRRKEKIRPESATLGRARVRAMREEQQLCAGAASAAPAAVAPPLLRACQVRLGDDLGPARGLRLHKVVELLQRLVA